LILACLPKETQALLLARPMESNVRQVDKYFLHLSNHSTLDRFSSLSILVKFGRFPCSP
jgi:hypothetical protein